jgi:hypothetical protein
MPKIETIEVQVLEIRWPKAGQENPRGWYSLKTNQGMISGNMKWVPQVNECLKITGVYDEWKGMRVFKFKEAMLNVPVDSQSQLLYVSERTKGIGPVLSEKIWEQFGSNWNRITAEDAKKLKINASVYELFLDQIRNLETDKKKADSIAFLMSKGCSSGMAATAWEQWEHEAIGIVNENCYRLADLPHYGFTHVDGDIRKAYGIGDRDKRRLRSATLYAMSELTSSGSTVISWSALCRELGKMKIDLSAATQVITEMFDDNSLRAFTVEGKLSMRSHYDAEMTILSFIRKAGIC